MPVIKTMEFQMDLCVLVVTTYTKKFGMHLGKLKENLVDYYTVAMKKNSGANDNDLKACLEVILLNL